jgi:putative transposase
VEGRKRIRTSPELYTGRGWYFLTVCTHGGSPVFANAPFARAISRHFLAAAAIDNFALHAWCIMPDHVHLLVEGLAMNCHVRHFMQRWKGGSTRSFRKRYGRDLWQRAYYDHILRPKELPHSFAWYIWLNPVRKGLCREPQDYPWSGSQTMDWKCRNPPKEQWIPPWRKGHGMPVGEGALALPQFGHVSKIAGGTHLKTKGTSDVSDLGSEDATLRESDVIADTGAERREG